jgi:hypothetical protein
MNCGGILNSGHERDLAYVLRCEGDDHEATPFSTWAPKAIALIGRLHPTLEDRSIVVSMKRRLATENVERIPKDANALVQLQRKCARWAKDNCEALRLAQPAKPKELHDRACDNWDPLLAIADTCGGEWPAEARKAARSLSAIDDDQTHAIQLLHDIRLLFKQEAGANLTSSFIVEELGKMEHRPWPEFSYGKPITVVQLAKLLQPFNVRPKQVRVEEQRAKGYTFAQFEKVFDRYLSSDADVKNGEKPYDTQDKATKSMA